MYLFLLWFLFKGNENQYLFLWRFVWCHKDFRGLIETAGSDPVVSLKLRDPIPQTHWHHGIQSSGLIDNTGSGPAVSRKQWISLRLSNCFTRISKSDPAVSLKLWEPIPRSHWDRGIRSRGLNWDRGIQTLQLLFRFSRRILSHMQNGFSPWIRVLGGLFAEKNRGSKISWHCPFKRW
jgi:hypothetical protein